MREVTETAATVRSLQGLAARFESEAAQYKY